MASSVAAHWWIRSLLLAGIFLSLLAPVGKLGELRFLVRN